MRKVVFRFGFLFLLTATQSAAFFPWEYVNKNNQGITQFREKRFTEAEVLFKKAESDNPANAEVKYNLGTALYKNSKLEESRERFDAVIADNEIKAELKQKAHYNLGNVYYRLGESGNTRINWLTALNHYEEAMKLNPEDGEARQNHDFVKEKLQNMSTNQQSQEQQSGQSEQNIDARVFSNSSDGEINNKKIYNVTKAEMENILEELKMQEEAMQKFINRKQGSQNSGQDDENSLQKDW